MQNFNSFLDENGQPLNKKYNNKRLNDRMIDELIGMAKGITADNEINKKEAEFILGWMNKNAKYCEDKIVNNLFARIKTMLADNILTPAEQKELLDILKSISGESCPADNTEATSATFPIDKPPPFVEVSGALFCFTGKFAYGPRRICTEAVIERGGIVVDTIQNELNYLVIGSLCSSDWIHSTYGRKIEKAVVMRDSHLANRLSTKPLAIIHEDHWSRHIFR